MQIKATYKQNILGEKEEKMQIIKYLYNTHLEHPVCTNEKNIVTLNINYKCISLIKQ